MGLRDRLGTRRSPEDAFADEVIRAARDLLRPERIERGDNFSLTITLANGHPWVMNLQNIFREAQQLDPAARKERIRRAVLVPLSGDRPKDWATAKTKLMPAVRTPSWAAASAVGGKTPEHRLYLPFVHALTAIDEEHGMSFVNAEDIETWLVDPADVEHEGLRNLAASPVPLGQPDDNCIDVLGPDGYASSWLLLPDALAQFAEPLGDFVVLAPSRDTLRLVGARDRAALQAELQAVEEAYRNAPRQLSPVPYAVRDGELVVWSPPDDDPLRVLVHRLQSILAFTEYGHQQEVLQGLLDKAGEDVFVATHALVERQDGSVWSWAAWVKEVTDGLLPRVDYLAMGENATESVLWVRWDDAARLAPDALRKEPGYYPPRWRVQGWPSDDAVRKLRAVATGPGGG